MTTETDSLTTTEDRNFDSLAERFRDRIYRSRKGELRLAILWEDMLQQIPELQSQAPLKVWDAGCGLGQIGLRIADLGHPLLMSDLSGSMLELAQQAAERHAGIAHPIEWRHASIQELAAEQVGPFDLIVCHAVMEWLGDPFATLERLVSQLADGGTLSLMFYNVNSVIVNNLIKGNFRKVRARDFAGHPGSLTPTNPLDPQEVYAALERMGLEIVSRCGIRVVSDLLRRDLQAERSYEDTLEMEQTFCRQEPFLSLARYIHVVVRKGSSE